MVLIMFLLMLFDIQVELLSSMMFLLMLLDIQIQVLSSCLNSRFSCMLILNRGGLTFFAKEGKGMFNSPRCLQGLVKPRICNVLDM